MSTTNFFKLVITSSPFSCYDQYDQTMATTDIPINIDILSKNVSFLEKKQERQVPINIDILSKNTKKRKLKNILSFPP